MNRTTFAFAIATLCALAGCHEQAVPSHPSPADSVVTTRSDSVAAPAASLPTPDAAMAPAAPSAKPAGGDSTNGPSQASQKSLTAEQESSGMPLAGQVNNHSTPAPLAPSQAADVQSTSGTPK